MNYEEILNNHAAEMIERLLTEVLSRDQIDIRFDYSDDEQWAVVSMHTEEENEISVRVHSDKYNLYFGYYDEDDDFNELTKELTAEEKESIPKGLRNAMEKVLKDERGLRLPGNFLSR